jgi:hypothetical protein
VELGLYLEWVPKIEAALTGCSLNSDVGTFFATFDRSSFKALQFCADLLGRERPEKTVDEGERGKLRDEALLLRKETESAEIDEHLKTFILEGLEEIISAIHDYDLEGIVSLERRVDRLFESLMRTPNKATKWRAENVWKRFGKILCHFSLVVSTANGLVALPHNVENPLVEYGVIEPARISFDLEELPAPPTFEEVKPNTEQPPAIIERS